MLCLNLVKKTAENDAILSDVERLTKRMLENDSSMQHHMATMARLTASVQETIRKMDVPPTSPRLQRSSPRALD